jgi:protein phosphatase
MQAYARTDIGCVRSMNQDSYFCSTTPVGAFPNLFIVADGMGGHQAGDYASRYAIEMFLEYVHHSEDSNLIRLMDEGISHANRKVKEKSFENEELAGMGTTLVVAYIEQKQLYVANVGDSRLYLISQEINQVTEDHSYVAAMMRAGELTPEQARNHPDKNVITRAIGVSWEVKADFFEVDLQEKDRILMCSDGLSNMVEDDRVFDILSTCGIPAAVDILVEEARKNGGYDNITVIVIEPDIEEVNEC